MKKILVMLLVIASGCSEINHKDTFKKANCICNKLGAQVNRVNNWTGFARIECTNGASFSLDYQEECE